MMPTRTLMARWLFPGDGPPLPGGLLTLRDGIILAVEPGGTRPADEDLGPVALIPGLVNAHTHLDLSGARDRIPPQTTDPFPHWLRAVIDYRRTRTEADVEDDIAKGLLECLRAGTTLLGDISAGGMSWPMLSHTPVRAVVFREWIGLAEDRSREMLAACRTWCEETAPTMYCRPGLSPHAPYTVHHALAREQLATFPGPMAVHLAESQAEGELLAARSGPFVPFLQSLGVWHPEALAQDAAPFLAAHPHDHWPRLLVHANHLPTDTPLTADHTIIYCPRTHAAFGHPPHPFQDWLARGIRVALGTDSLASNPDLDIFAEACFLKQQHPDLPGATLLHMLTLAGAEALGFAGVAGSLTPGKSADAVAIPISSTDGADPHELLFTAAAMAAPRRTLFEGVWRT